LSVLSGFWNVIHFKPINGGTTRKF